MCFTFYYLELLLWELETIGIIITLTGNGWRSGTSCNSLTMSTSQILTSVISFYIRQTAGLESRSHMMLLKKKERDFYGFYHYVRLRKIKISWLIIVITEKSSSVWYKVFFWSQLLRCNNCPADWCAGFRSLGLLEWGYQGISSHSKRCLIQWDYCADCGHHALHVPHEHAGASWEAMPLCWTHRHRQKLLHQCKWPEKVNFLCWRKLQFC